MATRRWSSSVMMSIGLGKCAIESMSSSIAAAGSPGLQGTSCGKFDCLTMVTTPVLLQNSGQGSRSHLQSSSNYNGLGLQTAWSSGRDHNGSHRDGRHLQPVRSCGAQIIRGIYDLPAEPLGRRGNRPLLRRSSRWHSDQSRYLRAGFPSSIPFVGVFLIPPSRMEHPRRLKFSLSPLLFAARRIGSGGMCRSTVQCGNMKRSCAHWVSCCPNIITSWKGVGPA